MRDFRATSFAAAATKDVEGGSVRGGGGRMGACCRGWRVLAGLECGVLLAKKVNECCAAFRDGKRKFSGRKFTVTVLDSAPVWSGKQFPD